MDSKKGINGEIITTLKNSCYGYDVTDMDTTSKAYTMLFKDGLYWLATASISVMQITTYNINVIQDGGVPAAGLCYSNTSCAPSTIKTRGVRAVVSLAPDIQLNGSSATGWSY